MQKKSRLKEKREYDRLLKDIGRTVNHARQSTVIAVNQELVRANWHVGRQIVLYEQRGNERAEYGSELLNLLSKDLRRQHGKGFSRRNILDMRRFYLGFPEWQHVPLKLSWSHFVLLLGLSDENARNYYLKQSLAGNWGYRELERQINSSLYERTVLSKSRRKELPASARKQYSLNPRDAVKDPYVLDFLGLPAGKRISEKQFEKRIIDNMQSFLLELGKGFAFVARQYHILIRNNHFYVDLVFYHRILKCFVLLELKTRPVRHGDIGQMNLYLNYFAKEENVTGDHEPIGIILAADKDEVLVEYATGGISNRIFVSKYQLYLPDKNELQSRLNNLLEGKKDAEKAA